ncbi:MAG: creatininase family protein [Pseudomonadota bacterium]|nr:creatininase family protein [Pseudomonadota bacterium]MDE3037433.1 creatininase family protein [Pseudomonadota bacterium]
MRIPAAAVILLASVSSAAAAPSFYLEDLTWPEVKARMERGARTIIVPSGGTEQNGPAIAIGKHNWIVQYTSGEIARELGDALAAPVIAYVPEGNISPPEGHMRFPGTISVSGDDYARILEDAARSFRQEGFTTICFIGDHGGDQKPQRQVAETLNEEWAGQGVKVIAVGDYYAGKSSDAWVKAQRIPVKDPEAHAGFMDASEVMAVRPGGVRPALLKPYTPQDYAALGAEGDETRAAAAYGKTLLSLRIKAAVDQIRRVAGGKIPALNQPDTAPPGNGGVPAR